MSFNDKKITATIGPASFAPSIVRAMDRAGVDLFRINLSHTAVEDFEFVYNTLRSWTDKPVCPDTRGVENRNSRGMQCLSRDDLRIFEYISQLEVSTVFLSFCSWEEDVADMRERFDYDIKVVSKIENSIGLRNLKEICKVSDEILIDRGDLSKDVPLVKIPYAQDYIVKEAGLYNTPVHVATNLMESMLSEPTPTRAEVNDIVKTLESGVSGLVLAGETAIGRHPVEAVKTLKTIIKTFNEQEGVVDEVSWLTY